jgi:hypothetical protein
MKRLMAAVAAMALSAALAAGPAGAAPAPGKDRCEDGGSQAVHRSDGSPFKNQGDCVSYVNHGGTFAEDNGGGGGGPAT